MAKVIPGRFTAETDEVVVFLIGMRINKLWKVHKWGPVLAAMGPMLKELFSHPEKGLLGARTYLGWRGPLLVQYWRDFESLERFAKASDEPHFPAWRRFNKAIGNSGDVGIWHETYLVKQGSYEAVYGNMPVFGLAAATKHVPVAKRGDAATERLGKAP